MRKESKNGIAGAVIILFGIGALLALIQKIALLSISVSIIFAIFFSIQLYNKIKNCTEELTKKHITYTFIFKILLITTIILISLFMIFVESNETISIILFISAIISLGFALAYNSKRKDTNNEINHKKYMDEQDKIVLEYSKKFKKNNTHYSTVKTKPIYKKSNTYERKSEYQTNCEKYYYKIIKEEFGTKYDIFPQVPLSSVIKKNKAFEKQYQNELYRTIDFGIFNTDTQQPILLIEINDVTHKNQDRMKRDNRVKEICKIANIDLITFWTTERQDKEYIIEKIHNILDYKL